MNNILSHSLISSLQHAAHFSHKRDSAEAVKHVLLEENSRGTLQLPGSLLHPLPSRYARRLLHHDSASDFTVVAMTWGVGQGTPLHDHAGAWCVETVVYGAITVQHYDLQQQKGELFQFAKMKPFECGVGTAGALIPPFDYHTIANASANDVAVTLHVYGKNMTECGSYQPEQEDWYRRVMRSLTYDPLDHAGGNVE